MGEKSPTDLHVPGRSSLAQLRLCDESSGLPWAPTLVSFSETSYVWALGAMVLAEMPQWVTRLDTCLSVSDNHQIFILEAHIGTGGHRDANMPMGHGGDAEWVQNLLLIGEGQKAFG